MNERARRTESGALEDTVGVIEDRGLARELLKEDEADADGERLAVGRRLDKLPEILQQATCTLSASDEHSSREVAARAGWVGGFLEMLLRAAGHALHALPPFTPTPIAAPARDAAHVGLGVCNPDA